MDCVSCDKCRLWGKLQTHGMGTALKILFTELPPSRTINKTSNLNGYNPFNLMRYFLNIKILFFLILGMRLLLYFKVLVVMLLAFGRLMNFVKKNFPQQRNIPSCNITN